MYFYFYNIYIPTVPLIQGKIYTYIYIYIWDFYRLFFLGIMLMSDRRSKFMLHAARCRVAATVRTTSIRIHPTLGRGCRRFDFFFWALLPRGASPTYQHRPSSPEPSCLRRHSFVRATRPKFQCAGPKTSTSKYARKIVIPTDGSTLEELNRSEGIPFFGYMKCKSPTVG